MNKKLMLFLILILSLVGCGKPEKNLEFHEDFDKIQEFYDTSIYKVIDVEFDSKISQHTMLYDKTYYVTDGGSYFHVSTFFNNSDYKNSPYYLKDNDKYYEYSLNSKTGLFEKKPYELVDLDKIVLSGLPTLENYEQYLEKTTQNFMKNSYIANIQYEDFTKEDKKEIETRILKIEEFKDYEITINSVNVRYDIMPTSLDYNMSINANFKYIGSKQNVTVIEFQDTMQLKLKYSNSYFEKHSYDGYFLEDEIVICNSIDKVTSTTDLNSLLYLASNNNYYLFNLKKGYYKVASSQSVNYNNSNLKVKLFDKNKNEISTQINDFLLADSYIASSFFIKEDGDYYVCINNLANGYYAKLYQLEYDDFIENENSDFYNASSTFINVCDVDKYILKCDDLTLLKIESNIDCYISLYYKGLKYSIAYNGPTYILIEEGIHDIYLQISNPFNYPYPISYSLTIDKMVIENPTYGAEHPYDGVSDVITGEFSENIYFIERMSRYFVFESNEEGFYKFEYQYVNDFNNEDVDFIFYSVDPDSGNSITEENGYFYLKANTNYIFSISSNNTAINAKISYEGVIYKDVNVNLAKVENSSPNVSDAIANQRENLNEIVRYHFTLNEETTVVSYENLYIYSLDGNEGPYEYDGSKYSSIFNSYINYIVLPAGEYYFEVPLYLSRLESFNIYCYNFE